MLKKEEHKAWTSTMVEYIINDVLREFLIFIGEIFLTLRSLQLFSLSGCLCYMSGLKDTACVVKPINLADSHPAAFVWTKALLVQCNELLPFRALMRSCGKGSWNSALNFATIFCDGGFLVYLFIYFYCTFQSRCMLPTRMPREPWTCL